MPAKADGLDLGDGLSDLIKLGDGLSADIGVADDKMGNKAGSLKIGVVASGSSGAVAVSVVVGTVSIS